MTEELETSSLLLKQRRSLDIFAGTVGISLLLHLLASMLLLLPGRYSGPSAEPLFVELQSMAAPVEAPLAEARQAESLPEPQPEVSPQTLPETARLAETIDNTLQKAVQTPEAVHESSIGLGMISGHFASFAQGESLRDDVRIYYFELMRRINEVWWTSGATKGSFVAAAAVNIIISRDGKIIGSELMASSGSREQDQALLESIKNAEPLPPLPESFPQRIFIAPIRFVPPLRLMFSAPGSKLPAPH